MSILQRYLFRESLAASVMSLAVFVGVILALFMAELLGEAAQGQLPAASMLALLLLRLPEAMLLVGPLALMTGLLLAFGRLGEQSELVVIRSAGSRYRHTLIPVLRLAALWSAVLLLVAGWLAPAAIERTGQLMADAARYALVAGLQPGQFESFEQGRLIIYVGAIDRADGSLRDVFVQHGDPERPEVLTAARGRLWTDADSDERYLSLLDGLQVQHAAGLADAGRREIRFARNDIRLPVPVVSGGSEGELVMTLPELRRQEGPAAHREWHWRLAAPLAALVLAGLALPLSNRLPRQGRFGPIVLALGIYLVYTNAVHGGLVMLEQREVSGGFGLWPLHLGVAVLAVIMTWRQARQW
ncbi:MAG: LPS export ABC transporter permease LptF [Wenzhouxiangella sp.]